MKAPSPRPRRLCCRASEIQHHLLARHVVLLNRLPSSIARAYDFRSLPPSTTQVTAGCPRLSSTIAAHGELVRTVCLSAGLVDQHRRPSCPSIHTPTSTNSSISSPLPTQAHPRHPQGARASARVVLGQRPAARLASMFNSVALYT